MRCLPVPPLLPLSAIRQPAFLFAPDGRVLATNVPAEKLAGRPLEGCSLEEFIGVFGLRWGDGRPVTPDGISLPLILPVDGPGEVHLGATASDGRWFDLVATASPIKSGDKIAAMLVLWQDVTYLQAMEETLLANAQTVRALVNGPGEKALLLEVDGTILEMSESCAAALGRSARALTGENAWTVLPPGMADRRREHVERVVTTRAPLQFAEILNGRRYESVVVPILSDAGRVVRVAIRTREIRDGEETGDRFRNILELSLDAVYRRDLATDHYDYVSPAIEAITGYSSETFQGLTTLEFLARTHPEDRGTVLHVIGDPAVGTGVAEYRFRHRDGSYRWLSDHFIVRAGDGQRARYRGGVVRDVTGLHQMVDDLRRSNEELQRFAYVASHDLQEPLRSIVSFSQLLERRYKGKLGEDADDYIRFIVDGGTRMQRLILDLLHFSRVETQARPPSPTDAAEVVADALRSLRAAIAEADALVTVGNLPVVMADAAQLEQVFSNLISNAIKYRRQGARPEITVSAVLHGERWTFSIADNGIGIETEYFNRIFEMFRRLHTRERYEGTGIGLAVVKKIVERHGGTAWVESEPGEGSTFYFTLPAA